MNKEKLKQAAITAAFIVVWLYIFGHIAVRFAHWLM
jgi:hypothetical protein